MMAHTFHPQEFITSNSSALNTLKTSPHTPNIVHCFKTDTAETKPNTQIPGLPTEISSPSTYNAGIFYGAIEQPPILHQYHLQPSDSTYFSHLRTIFPKSDFCPNEDPNLRLSQQHLYSEQKLLPHPPESVDTEQKLLSDVACPSILPAPSFNSVDYYSSQASALGAVQQQLQQPAQQLQYPNTSNWGTTTPGQMFFTNQASSGMMMLNNQPDVSPLVAMFSGIDYNSIGGHNPLTAPIQPYPNVQPQHHLQNSMVYTQSGIANGMPMVNQCSTENHSSIPLNFQMLPTTSANYYPSMPNSAGSFTSNYMMPWAFANTQLASFPQAPSGPLASGPQQLPLNSPTFSVAAGRLHCAVPQLPTTCSTSKWMQQSGISGNKVDIGSCGSAASISRTRNSEERTGGGG